MAPNSNSLALVVASTEVNEFLEQANAKYKHTIEAFRKYPRNMCIIRVVLLLIILAIAVGLGAGLSVDAGVAVAILGTGAIIGLARIPYYYVFRGRVEKFAAGLAEWIKQHRGPLYAKGVKPRPGPFAAYIIFEVNVQQ